MLFMNNYFDSKAIYCLISLSNSINNEEALQSANCPELKILLGNEGNKSKILPFWIQESQVKKRGITVVRKCFQFGPVFKHVVWERKTLQ